VKVRELLLGDVHGEFVDGPFGSNLKASEYVDRGVPIIRLQNIRPNVFLEKQIKFVSEKKALELKRHSYKSGDVVIAKLGDVGTACVVPPNCQDGVIVADVIRFRSDESDVNHRYLSHFLNSPAGRGRVLGFSKGSTRVRTNLSDLRKVSIPLPPIAEQRRIASILDKADALRAKRREAIAKLDQLLRSVFFDMFGDPVTNPKGWPTFGIADLAQILRDGPFGSNLKSEHYQTTGVRVVRLQNIGVWEFLGEDAAYISEEHFASLPRNHCRPGDVLIGTLGDPNLRACILPDNIDRALNKADCLLFRCNRDIATAEYVCGLLNCESLMQSASGLALGQTRLRVSMGRLKELTVPAPPLAEQQRFTDFCTRLNRERAALLRSCAATEQLFASLQTRTFSGQPAREA
jgi:type I restriction enzyme, S subunit